MRYLLTLGTILFASAAFANSSHQSQTADANTNIGYENLNPANTAFAPALAVGGESCMGSSSVGGQGLGLGVSIGSTWHDLDCERRHNAATLYSMGERHAAVALMCQDPAIRAAMVSVSDYCPDIEEQVISNVKQKIQDAYPSNHRAIE